MSRTRGKGGLGSPIVAAAVVFVAASAGAHAQNGYSADPFWPYNSQYTPYANPMASDGGPGGGISGGTLNSREGIRGANRFEDYLDSVRGESMQGPGRNISDRSSIGLPYYRSAVDPDYQVRGRAPRQYIPNARTTETFEQSQRRVSDFYFEYSAERDPEIRARLWRQYRSARRQASLGLSDSRRSSRRTTATGAGLDTSEGTGRSDHVRRTQPRPGDDFGPPPIPHSPSTSDRSSRAGSPLASPRRKLSPRDILNRSRTFDLPGAGSRSPRPRGLAPAPRSRRSTTTTPPATNLDRP